VLLLVHPGYNGEIVFLFDKKAGSFPTRRVVNNRLVSFLCCWPSGLEVRSGWSRGDWCARGFPILLLNVPLSVHHHHHHHYYHRPPHNHNDYKLVLAIGLCLVLTYLSFSSLVIPSHANAIRALFDTHLRPPSLISSFPFPSVPVPFTCSLPSLPNTLLFRSSNLPLFTNYH